MNSRFFSITSRAVSLFSSRFFPRVLAALAFVEAFATSSTCRGEAMFVEEFINQVSGANQNLSSIGWEAYGNATAVELTSAKGLEITGGIFVASGAGNPASPTGFLACGLMNDLAFNEYVAIKTDLKLDNPSKFSWRMHSTPGSQIDVRLLVQIGDKWYASSKEFNPQALGGPGEFPAVADKDCEVVIAFSRKAEDWKHFQLEPGSSLALGEALNADLPNLPVTGVGLYVATSGQTPSMLRLDTFEALP